MKKITHLSIRHTPFDTRIFHKECKTLANNGYDVSFLVPSISNEVVDSIKIIALKKYNSKISKFIKNFLSILFKCFEINSDIYHIHDPELIPIGLFLKIKGKKIIYDVHEDHPKDVFEKNWSMALKIFVSMYFTILEKFSSAFFDCTIAATQHIFLKFPPNKTILIRNVPLIGIIDNSPIKIIKKQIPILIFQGGITKLRGIGQIIQSMEYVSKNCELWLFGKWEENFREECTKLIGWNKTKYMGIVTQEELYGYDKIASIGIINYLSSPNNKDALPNKPFEYMACSIPMIMSDFPHWKEMFSNCALFVNPDDPKDIAEKINILLNDKNLCEKLGKRGRELVEEKYNWEKESKKLLDLYKGL